MVTKIGKKGQTLSMNTVIIAILVLVVLVFIIIFFTGGFSSIGGKIRDTMFGVSAGQDKSIALQNCQTYCDQAMDFGNNKELVRSSPYCTKTFRIDMDNDGSADKSPEGEYLKFYCSDNHAGDDSGLERALGISCPIGC